MAVIEIPFGARDSELKGWEYTIPEGMEAVIEEGKIIVREKESEDERIRKEIKQFILDTIGEISIDDKENAWLTYLEKHKEQKQSEMEKEYVRTLHSLISDFLRGKQEIDREYYQKIWDWLDNRHIEQKPAEWSEEDERFRMICSECVGYHYSDGLIKKETYEKVTKWLKLRRPQSHWKPSKEQMNALKNIAYGSYQIGDGPVLRELYDNLKKL